MTDPGDVGDGTVVRAAGGVPWRRGGDDGDLEVLLVHRDRYGDWSFPKGKLDPGETWEQAAVREVWEEAAIVAVLGTELPATEYRDRFGRPKRVRYWSMLVAADAGFVAGDEISDRRWVSPAEAASLLTYVRDRDVLAALVRSLAD